jgi:hypothetical protein
VSGFWHGANWTFVIWGAIHALLFVPLILLKRNRKYTTDVVAEGKLLPSLKDVFAMGSTFALVCLAWVFFRADTVSEAINYIVGFTELPTSDKPITHVVYTAFVWIGVMVLVDWLQRDGTIPRWWLNRNLQPLRWFTYGICVWLCFKNLHSEASFIYFQF